MLTTLLVIIFQISFTSGENKLLPNPAYHGNIKCGIYHKIRVKCQYGIDTNAL